jgi:hypothetical protein
VNSFLLLTSCGAKTTQELPICPRAKLDWKCWEFTSSLLSHWQISCRSEKSYSARGKFQQ